MTIITRTTQYISLCVFNRIVLFIEKRLSRFEKTRIKLNLILVLVNKKNYDCDNLLITQSTF